MFRKTAVNFTVAPTAALTDLVLTARSGPPAARAGTAFNTIELAATAVATVIPIRPIRILYPMVPRFSIDIFYLVNKFRRWEFFFTPDVIPTIGTYIPGITPHTPKGRILRNIEVERMERNNRDHVGELRTGSGVT
jgi:hypothetical protein